MTDLRRLDKTAILIAFGLLIAAPNCWMAATAAQDRELELGRENEQLRTRISDLEAALAAAMKKIESLEAEVKSLRNGAGGSTPSSLPQAIEILDSSPAGMVRKARDLYAKALEDGQIPEAGAAGDTAARTRFERALRKWIGSANRVLREPVEWPVVIETANRISATEARLELTPWNPKAGEAAGKPFSVVTTPRVLDKIRRAGLRSQDAPPIFVFKGVFVPRMRYNPQRTEVGPFDNPPFIAAGVEFPWSVEFKSLGDHEPAKEAKPDGGNP